jgi:hypothetical protein
MAHQDAIFVNFFGRDKEAAMLACDELGVWPSELLYLPKSVFVVTAPNEELASVRYTLRERSRQQTFRRLTALRTKYAADSSRLVELWMHRFQLMPDGPPIPDLDPVAVERAAAHDDTETDDDEFDEYFRRKPQLSSSPFADTDPFSEPSKKHPHSARHQQLSNSNSNPTSPTSGAPSPSFAKTGEPGSPLSKTSPLGSPSGTAAFCATSAFTQDPPLPQSPSKADVGREGRRPVPPRKPPVMPRVNTTALRRQEKILDVHKKRLAKFELQISTEEMLKAGRQLTKEEPKGPLPVQREPRASRVSNSTNQESVSSSSTMLVKPPASAGLSTTLGDSSQFALSSSELDPIPQLAPPVNSSPGRNSFNRLDADAMPAIGPSFETMRQMQAMLKSSMSTIVESAIGHATWRTTFEREEAERVAREKAKLLLSGRGGLPRIVVVNGTEMMLTPQELFRKREEALSIRKEQEHTAALIKAIQAEERQAEVVRRVEQAIEKQKHRQLLTFEAHRMRELLCDQKREWHRRAEEVRLLRLLAKSLPKYEHAEEVRQRKIMSADINKKAHTQLALMRKQVKDTLQNMIQTKDWDVPEALSEILSPELLLGPAHEATPPPRATPPFAGK